MYDHSCFLLECLLLLRAIAAFMLLITLMSHPGLEHLAVLTAPLVFLTRCFMSPLSANSGSSGSTSCFCQVAHCLIWLVFLLLPSYLCSSCTFDADFFFGCIVLQPLHSSEVNCCPDSLSMSLFCISVQVAHACIGL